MDAACTIQHQHPCRLHTATLHKTVKYIFSVSQKTIAFISELQDKLHVHGLGSKVNAEPRLGSEPGV